MVQVKRLTSAWTFMSSFLDFFFFYLTIKVRVKMICCFLFFIFLPMVWNCLLRVSLRFESHVLGRIKNMLFILLWLFITLICQRHSMLWYANFWGELFELEKVIFFVVHNNQIKRETQSSFLQIRNILGVCLVR